MFKIFLHRFISALVRKDKTEISYTEEKIRLYINDTVKWSYMSVSDIYNFFSEYTHNNLNNIVERYNKLYCCDTDANEIYKYILYVMNTSINAYYPDYKVNFNYIKRNYKYRYEHITDFLGYIMNYIYFKQVYGDYMDYNLVRSIYSYINHLDKILPHNYRHKRKIINECWKSREFDTRPDLYHGYNKYLFMINDKNYRYSNDDFLNSDNFLKIPQIIYEKIIDFKKILIFGTKKDIYHFIENLSHNEQ